MKNLLKKLKTLSARFALLIIEAANYLIPKNNTLVLFYSSFGFDDNARAVYEGMKNNSSYPNFKLIWIVKNKKDFINLKEKCIFLQKNSIRGVWAFLRAKLIVKTHSIYDNRFNKKKQIVVFCMHGMTIKGLNKNIDPKWLTKYNYCDIYTVSSVNYFDVMSQVYCVPKEKMVNWGLPRNDFLFKKNDVLKIMGFDNYKKIVIWMPTFRKSKDGGYFDGKFNDIGIPVLSLEGLKSLDEYLFCNNVLLIIKLHPWAVDSSLDFNAFNNIIAIKNSDIPYPFVFYNLLAYCDAIITDYSSVYIDYLLLNRPIAFAYDDFEEYSKTRTWAFDNIEKYMVGYRLSDLSSFFAFLDDVIKGHNAYYEEQKKINSFFNDYADGKSTKRLIDCFSNLLKKKNDKKRN